MEQYISLYKHEDNLNWTKLNHLIISTLGISAGIGFILDKNDVFHNSVIYLLFALGGLVILGFGISINSGVKNMKYWKSKIIEAERITQNPNLCPNCSKEFCSILENPATRNVLFFLPWLFLSLWIVALLMYILKCIY